MNFSQSGALWVGEQNILQAEETDSLLNIAPFLVPEIDASLNGGVQLGHIHEWSTSLFGNEPHIQTKKLFPPHLILSSLIRNTLIKSESLNLPHKKVVVWIGEESWPSLHLLNLIAQDLNWDWQQNVLFINPASRRERLSAFRSCLRSPAVLATIGDASSFNHISTRQLQLAARVGGGLGFLLRRGHEQVENSCSQSKWLVEPVRATTEPGPLKGIRALNGTIVWRISLLKAHGVKAPQTWEVELQKDPLMLKIYEENILIKDQIRFRYGS